MSSPVHEISDLLRLFANEGTDDQDWSDFGEERASRTFTKFSDADWDALLELSERLSSGELDVLSAALESQTHRYVLPLLLRSALRADGDGWIALEALAHKFDVNPGAFEPYKEWLREERSVQFIEKQLRRWLNFPQPNHVSFDVYLAEHRHLVPSSVLSLVAYARRSPNNSLERTRDG